MLLNNPNQIMIIIMSTLIQYTFHFFIDVVKRIDDSLKKKRDDSMNFQDCGKA